MGYLYDVHGRELVRAIWREGPGTLARVPIDYPNALWSEWVADRASSVPPGDLASIERKGCG